MAGACRGRDNELSAPHWQGGSRSAPAHAQALHEKGAGREAERSELRPSGKTWATVSFGGGGGELQTAGEH